MSIKRKVRRYQVKVLMSKEEYVHDKLKTVQAEGWEMAGDIVVKNQSGSVGDTYLFIPLRKLQP